MRASPAKAIQERVDSPSLGAQRHARSMKSSPASYVVEQSFAQLPPQTDGVLFGKLLNLDSALPDRVIIQDSEGEDSRPQPHANGSARFGSEDQFASPVRSFYNGRVPPGSAPALGRRTQEDRCITPPRPRSSLERMGIPEEGTTYMQKSTSEFALGSSGGLKHRKNLSSGSSSRSVPGESGRESALISSDGWRRRQMQSPASGRRPTSSRAMPGEEVQFAAPASAQGTRGHSRSSRARPGDEFGVAPMAEMYPPSSGATTPVRMPSHGRMDNESFIRMSSGRGTSATSAQYTPTSKTARSVGLSETQRSVQVSESGSTWTKDGVGNSWQREFESRLEFTIQTPGKWLSTHPVTDRQPWVVSNGRIPPGGPLHFGGLAIISS